MAKKEHGNTIALLNNNNAEKYTHKQAEELLLQALELSNDLEYDFIGEIARQQKVTRRLYDHLITRFPDLRELFEMMKSNLEANCYENTKKNKINTAVGIINLKSNHKWNDRPQEEPIKLDTNTEIVIRKATNE